MNEEWIEKSGKGWDEIDKVGREATLKLGNKIIPLSKQENERWAKAVRPLLDEYVDNMKVERIAGGSGVEVLPGPAEETPIDKAERG